MSKTIAIDAMGGDFGPSETVPAALHSIKKHKGLSLILVGRQEELEKEMEKHAPYDRSRITLQHASEIIDMHELPSVALRNKKGSSMRIAIDLVKKDKAHACVSAGNTGALMAIARYILKMLPGIDRPAICTTMPGIHGSSYMLDLGANIDSSSEQLLQFAVMGSELSSAIKGKKEPKVALLNIGAEEIKGNDRVKQAAVLLAKSRLNYTGFIEGNDIYTGHNDVIVCDGFAGNIALKSSEGAALFLKYFAVKAFNSSLYGRFAAMLAAPILNSLKKAIDPRQYNGASLLGLRGIVVKSHGNADRISFAAAIEVAMLETQKNIPERISARLSSPDNGGI